MAKVFTNGPGCGNSWPESRTLLEMLAPLAPLSEVPLGRQVPEHGQSFCQGCQLGKFLVSVQDPSGKCWFPFAPLSDVALNTQVPEHGQSFLPREPVGEISGQGPGPFWKMLVSIGSII